MKIQLFISLLTVASLTFSLEAGVKKNKKEKPVNPLTPIKKRKNDYRKLLLPESELKPGKNNPNDKKIQKKGPTLLESARKGKKDKEKVIKEKSKQVKAKEQKADKEKKKAAAKKLAKVCQRILNDVSERKATKFEKVNIASDLLRGYVTNSKPAGKGDKRSFVAHIYIQWGDLDNKIPKCSSKFYQNWDGYVKVQEAGWASVVKEFKFDSGKGEPQVGSGRDKMVKSAKSSQVVWKSGIVGSTDGILVKLDLHKSTAKGSIKVGKFVIPYVITPASGVPTKPGKKKEPKKKK